jgi:hypothetical protein
MICYFDGFVDDAGMADVDVGYDVCSVEVSAMFCLSGVLATADLWFFSLVFLICSEILVDM